MSELKHQTVIIYYDTPHGTSPTQVIAKVTASRIVVVSQYADLRDEQDKLIATITWKSGVKARVV